MFNIGIHELLYSRLKCFLIDRAIQTRIKDEVSAREVLEKGLQNDHHCVALFTKYI